MTVFVTGMHRSGTSMVARLLNLCGLYLGPEESLMPPHPDNLAGFWENLTVYKINETILDKLGGGWDYLPREIKIGWERNSSLEPIQDTAKGLIRDFNEHDPWGWKDPRFCFTLPFWQSLLSESRVIICLRHPLEVAGSLMKRNGHSRAFGLHLWLEHNQRLLDQTSPEQRIVTHYDTYFTNPRQELRRLVDWLGWTIPEQTISQACESISRSLRHHYSPRRPGRPAEMPAEVARLYHALESDAGPVYDREPLAEGAPPVSETAPPAPPVPDTAIHERRNLPQEAHTPTVSVVIPAYNPRYFKDALESALGQTYTPLEILISDDCPTGEIKAVVDEVAPSDERVRYVKNERQLGRYGNYQRCFEMATGEYVKYLNDDDLLHPDCVTLMVRCLQRYPDVTLVTSHRQVIDAQGKYYNDITPTRRPASEDCVIDGISACNAILSRRLNFVGEPTTTLFRKRDLADVCPTINSVGGIQFEHINDIAMWLNLLSKGDLIYLVKTLSYFRLHGEQGQGEPGAIERAQVYWNNILEQGLRLGYWHPDWSVVLKMRSLDIRPQWSDDILPHIKQANEYLSQGNFEAAMQAFRTAMILAPDDPWLEVTLGNVLLQSGDVENAWQEYLKVTQLHPDFGLGYVKLGEAALQLGRVDEAEKALTKALVIQPENMDARKFLGRIYLDTKRVKEGIQAFTIVVKQQPYDIDGLLALGTCSIELGVYDSARALFEWVLEIDPQNRLARENLAVVNSRESVSPESGSISG